MYFYLMESTFIRFEVKMSGYLFADIKSLEKTMEKMLDKREQGSRVFIDNVTKTLEASVETSMARKLEELKRLLGSDA